MRFLTNAKFCEGLLVFRRCCVADFYVL